MFNNFAKFELPAIRGSELWPDAIRSPVVVRAALNYAATGDNAAQAADVLTSYFHEVVDNHTPEILNFLVTQRQNYQNGIVDFASTVRNLGPITLHYTNMQSRMEVLKIEGDVSEEKFAELAEKFAPRSEGYEEREPSLYEPPEEEERKYPRADELLIVILHGGNKVSYAPMTALNDTAGVATRRTMRNSNWGTEIIRTCQISIGNDFGAIYSELTGITNRRFSRGTKYYITSSQLYEDRITESYPAAGIAPILNGSNMTAYVGSADVRFSTTGRIRSFVDVPYELDDVNQDPIAPWAISPGGDRYSAFHLYIQWTESLGGIGVDLDSVGPGDSNERANYEGFWFSDQELNLPPGLPYWYKLNGSKVSYMPSGGANAAGENDVPGANPFYFWSHYDSSSSGGAGVPIMQQSGGAAIIGSTPFAWTYAFTSDGAGFYTYWPLAEPDTITITEAGSTLSESASFDDKSYAHSVNYSGITGTWPINNPPPSPPYPSYMNYLMVLIPFPYSLPGRPCWKRISQHLQTASGSPVSSYISTYETPYGESYSRGTFEPGGFTGWLNISNTKHLIQGYAFYPNTSDRHMYLDGRKISSLFGVPVSDIQTVFFDVPQSVLDRFS